MDKHRKRRAWNPKIVIEYVPFPNEIRRDLSYELSVESILYAYRNWFKYEKEKAKKEEREFNPGRLLQNESPGEITSNF